VLISVVKLSTPSLGITGRVAVGLYAPTPQFPTFNSLSRDHAAARVKESSIALTLSTPSLGITGAVDDLAAIHDLAEAFNSLSRDHCATFAPATEGDRELVNFQLPLSGSQN